MPNEAPLTNTPVDVLAYQNELVRTGKCLPLGRMKMISIAPNALCPPLPTWDSWMKAKGRLIQLRDQVLPISQSPDLSMILVNAPLLNRDGRVALPELAEYDWVAPQLSTEEITGKVPRSIHKAPMIEQSLRARAEGFLEGTKFYVFSPVLSIAFQPEQDHKLLGTFWAIDCSYNPADRTHPTLLIHAETGETHFFGGLYDVVRATGEN